MLLTKIHIPTNHSDIIRRKQLYDKLELCLSCKLSLISAPAGCGKTTLLSDWITQRKIPTAWFSIDDSDNDPVEFFTYIISGIQSIKKDFGNMALMLLHSPQKPSNEAIAKLLINEILNINKNFLLVLDDFHLINNIEIINLIIYFLEHIPKNIHISILTRSDPCFSLARLRSHRQILELRLTDLSFSAEEISYFFNKKLKIMISDEDAQLLEAKTEGWIAGLQLTALSLQKCEDKKKYIENLLNANQYILDYLIEEVLKAQTNEIKDFLLHTSVLEKLSAQLCNAVLNRNDSHTILSWLNKNNMFLIPLDDEGTWYRYHHLFADLLKQQLLLKENEVIQNIHQNACEWFEKNDMKELAIEHTLAIKNYDKCIQMVGSMVEDMWNNGRHSTILKYGSLLPDEVIKKNAEFCLYFAWILMINGELQKAELLLTNSENIAQNALNSENLKVYDKKLFGKIAVAFSSLYSLLGNPDKTIYYSELAMENLSEDDPLWYSWGWYSIGIAASIKERFEESIIAYDKALEYGRKSGNIFVISTVAFNLAYHESRMGLYSSSYKKCSDLLSFMKENGFSNVVKFEPTYAGLYSCLAGIECMRTEYENALENIKIAYRLSKNEPNSSHKIVVLLVYSIILYGLGDIDGVEVKVKEMDNIVKSKAIAPTAKAIYIAMKGFILIKQNKFELTWKLLQDNGLDPDSIIKFSDEHGYTTFVNLLIAENQLDKAEILLSKLYEMSIVTNRIERMIEHKIFFSILFKAKGDREKAIENLKEAFTLANNDCIIYDFVLHYEKIKDMLEEIFKNHNLTNFNIPKKLIDKLKLALEKREKFIKAKTISGLSLREIETLKLLSSNLSNKEIADKLFLSINTVKSHVKNILIKLEVENRNQAVSKAKDMHII